MKDNVKYTAKCELYEETDKEFKFNVFLNETGVIAWSHGLIVLEVTYDRITNKHSIRLHHHEDDSLLVSSEVGLWNIPKPIECSPIFSQAIYIYLLIFY